ncbi:MAG: dTDP-glucose 4,6-dehydratase [bacterium]
MRVLITGGAGFIGSNLIRYILHNRPQWEVINYDLLTYAGNLESLEDIQDNPRYHFIRGDVADGKAVREAMQGCEAVFHLAAESHVDRSIWDASPFIRTNILGTQVLMEAARDLGVKRFLQVSTDEVYGTLGPEDPPFTEDNPLKPNSPYSASKASADLLVRAYVKTYHFPAIITRCSNNYGPYQFPEKLIPLVIRNALQGIPIPIYGDGRQVRDWIYVEDHCEALVTVMEKGKEGEIYNIGGHTEMENIQLVRLILEELGCSDSLIRFVKDRPAHDRRYAMDTTYIETHLGWQPRHDFNSAIKKTILWYKEHPDWIESVTSGAYREYYQRQYGDR